MKRAFKITARAVSCVAALLWLCPTTGAQDIVLKTGQTVPTGGVRRSGDTVMCKIKVGASSGEVGYQVVGITKILFPEPAQIKSASEFLSQGLADKALTEINPVIRFHETFRDIPGNWWAQAALIKISALAAMRLDREATALGEEIRKFSTDPESSRAAQLQIAGALVRKQEYDKALEVCDSVIKDSAKPGVLAEAWVNKGDVFLAQKQWDGAALAYLHVPVFYPNEKLLMPPAMLGSARAFRGLDDLERAKKSLNELIKDYPKSAQAALAQTELKKIPK
jgi:tetratricopeptide (TPR) repeat protein